MTFADRLTEIRKCSGMTQKEAAEKLGITPQAYYAYESGKREPRLDNLVKLSKIFNVSLDTLCGENPYTTSMTLDDCRNFSDSIDGCHIAVAENKPEMFIVSVRITHEYTLRMEMNSTSVISMCQNANSAKDASMTFKRLFKDGYIIRACKYSNSNCVIF